MSGLGIPGLAVLVAAGGAQLSRLLVPWKWRDVIEAAGGAAGVDPNELHAIALHETGGKMDPTLVSAPNANGTRDYGLFQINDTNLARFGLTGDRWKDPRASADAAAALIVANRSSAIALAGQPLGFFDELAAYNAGLSTLHPGRPKLDARGAYINQAYVREVSAWYGLVILASVAPIQKVS